MVREGGAFGGEENGGLIFPEFQYCRDGAFAVAKILEIASNLGRLSKVNDAIPQYSQFKTKVGCPESKKIQVMNGILRSAKSDRIDTTDGVKVYYDDGWVLVRPSGTEPIVRIFTESRAPERAKDLADSSKRLVEKLVKG
jgi:phosphomannomutase/phosphoglucomutase